MSALSNVYLLRTIRVITGDGKLFRYTFAPFYTDLGWDETVLRSPNVANIL